jgi:polyphosphate kinase 2 (PPK2 family)
VTGIAMFETAELGRAVPRKMFRKNAPALRQELLELQRELRDLNHVRVVLVFAGVDGAGKGETVNLLNGWMDPRWLQTRVFDQPSEVERERPEFWRYWLALPPRGRIGMFLSSWYSPPFLERVYGQIDDAELDHRLERIVAFENALAEDGAAIIKFWMHLSRDGQKARLQALEADPVTRGRVTQRDWEHWKLYDRFVGAAERVITRTNTGKAPWSIVEGADENYRSLTIATTLRDLLRRRIDEVHVERRMREELELARLEVRSAQSTAKGEGTGKKGTGAGDGKNGASGKKAPAEQRDVMPAPAAVPTVLSQLDTSARLEKAAYREALRIEQERLYVQQLEARRRGVPSVLVFEGPDAAGKGGAIRRITAAMDARNYQVHGFAAPTDEEQAQHYLWRFWRRLPRAGRMAIFDRSWYGRVLVERVEGFADENEWRRAYAEIVDFESQLAEHGVVVMKYWIHITPAEQLTRFKLREQTPYKRWKLTEEEWRNREQWPDYELAVNDMVQYTSTAASPWTLVEGNDKRFARVKVLRTLNERLAEHLGDGTG